MNAQEESPDIDQRAYLRDELRRIDEQTLDQRVDRYLEIDCQRIIGGHYFAEASSECISLYRDGHFISAVMLSQAVNERILKFVAERNAITAIGHDELMKCLAGKLADKPIVPREWMDASERIWGSFRNDVHHMNPKVVEVPFQCLAKRNLQDLAVIETEIFGIDSRNKPKHPQYWDIQENGFASAFLRFTI
jgi:hypothetical protein